MLIPVGRLDPSIRSSILRIAFLAALIFALSPPIATPLAMAASSPPLVLGSSDDAAAPRPRIEVVSSSSRGLTLQFSLPALTVDTTALAHGRTFQAVAIPGGGWAGALGAPEIPVYTRYVAIPPTSDVRVSSAVIEEQEDLPGYQLCPVQADPVQPDASEDGYPAGFAFDPSAYSRDDFGPPELTAAARRTGGPAILRDLRIVPITFQPVRFNPASGILRIARRMRVEISFEGTNTENALPTIRADRPIAPSFDRLYREVIINYEQYRDRMRLQVKPGMWVAICQDDADILTRLQPLADWHKRKGIPTRIATTAETGTTAAAIRNWIVNAYENWPIPPEYVAIVGDADGSYSMPFWTETLSGCNGGGDHPYSQLTGTDPLPDINVGRLSIGRLTDLETEVAKSVAYESDPYTTSDPDWFTRACLVGDPAHSGFSCVQVMQWAKTRLRQMDYAQIDTVFSGDFLTQMLAALNRGDGVFAYRGYLGMSGLSPSHIFNLTNYSKLPFCVMPTCDSGTWYSGTARSEAFLRAGSPTQSRGGIGAIGMATPCTHTAMNNCMAYGILYGLIYEEDYSMGAAFARGKIEMNLNYNADSATIWSYWNNLMGDPGVEIFTGFPTPLAVSAPATIPVGSNAVTVIVTDAGGNPAEGARVCLWKGEETYIVGRIDGSGLIELPVNVPTTGTLLLTVTKHNARPFLASIPVANSDVYVGYQSSTANDDATGESIGNGDGLVNPGERIELSVQVHNSGTETATRVTARLTTADPLAAIIDSTGTRSYGDIPPGGSALASGDYILDISPACPDAHAIRFGLEITSEAGAYHSIIEIPVVAAGLSPTGTVLYNAGSNRILDPGETVQMTVRLRNDGRVTATGIRGVLRSMAPLVYTTDDAGTWADLPVGQEVENSTDMFTVFASPQVYKGCVATFRLIASDSAGLVDTSYVSLPVGIRADVDPTGPDSHGYLAFEDTDTAYSQAPVYSWVELDPAFGGSGTQLLINDMGQYQDASCVISLPFPFTFYGQSYTKATACSNGWIAMGSTYLTEYRNWTIPGAGGPQAMIAPFWDDLAGGKVFTIFDGIRHLFVIEWSRFTNDRGSQETFECILYDPAFYPTSTGDGEIVYQYNTVNDDDAGDNYATVGVENIDHSDGLLCTFNHVRTGGTAAFVSGRAMRITTTIPGAADVAVGGGAPAIFALRQSSPNPWKGSTTISFTLDKPQAARLAIYDVQGRVVRRLIDGVRPAGPQSVVWDGRDDGDAPVPTGLYLCRLQTPDQKEVRKLVRVRR